MDVPVQWLTSQFTNNKSKLLICVILVLATWVKSNNRVDNKLVVWYNHYIFTWFINVDITMGILDEQDPMYKICDCSSSSVQVHAVMLYNIIDH